MAPKNPFEFQYMSSIQDYDFATPLGKSLWTEEPTVGGKYLKMTVRYVERSHEEEGYCSDYNFSENDGELSEYEVDDEILTVYMRIPEALCDADGDVKLEYIDDEKELVKDHEDTEAYYESWTTYSECSGSGVCGLTDSYDPVRIEYVEIV